MTRFDDCKLLRQYVENDSDEAKLRGLPVTVGAPPTQRGVGFQRIANIMPSWTSIPPAIICRQLVQADDDNHRYLKPKPRD